jgi:hypothetical protein
MADQLSGQWFANFLKLGDILEKERVKSTLRAIYKYNFHADAGLLNGALPDKFVGKGSETAAGLGEFTSPSLQRDNPWTGTEYAVASLLIQEGFIDEGLTIVKNVYDRYQKSGLTWNHIECGGHYYRAMDIWAVLTDLGGIYYNAPQQSLSFEPKMNQDNFKSVFVLPSAWGIIAQTRGEREEQLDTVKVIEGTLTISRLMLQAELEKANVAIQKGSTGILVEQLKQEGTSIQVELEEAVTVKPGETLQVRVNPY